MRDGEQEVSCNEIWSRVCARMRGEIGDAAYRSWLKPMAPRGIENGAIRLAVPTRFMRDWVLDHYMERLCAIWQEECPDVMVVEIVVQASRTPAAARKGGGIKTKKAKGKDRISPALSWDGLGTSYESHFTFDNFVVGKPNEFAHAAAWRVANESQVSFNPLFLHSGAGLGKTHLMYAIANQIRLTDPSRKVVYMSAESFMYRFIRAIREQNMVDFKAHLRSVDVLMIDDVQFIGNKESTQEEFFHTFNALVDQGRQIVLSADKSPADLKGMEDRLRSRLSCGLVADIHATTFELRVGILQSKAQLHGTHVPDKVIEFLARKITTNVRELDGALNRIIAHRRLMGREISLDAIQDVLGDVLRSCRRQVTIEEIQKQVAAHFNIKIADMFSARRARAVSQPRQVAMYLSKKLTSRSLPEIGRKFGGRDHTTVMHAVKRVIELCDRDVNFAEDVEQLRRVLEN